MFAGMGGKSGVTGMVNKGDRDGNTVLHCAAMRKQLKCVEALLKWSNKEGNANKVDVNARNGKGLTPLDMLDIVVMDYCSSSDIHLKEILRKAGSGGSSTNDQSAPESTSIIDGRADNHQLPTEKPKDYIEYFQFKWQRDGPSEVRSSLLLVAALYTTITFQAGINPPSFINEDWTITVFFIVNTLSFAASALVIELLTSDFPFKRELRLATFCIGGVYGLCSALAKPTSKAKFVGFMISICIPYFFRNILPCLMLPFRSSRTDHQNSQDHRSSA